MCIGCILGACVVGLLYGSGGLISWRANAQRDAAMKEIDDQAPRSEPLVSQEGRRAEQG